MGQEGAPVARHATHLLTPPFPDTHCPPVRAMSSSLRVWARSLARRAWMLEHQPEGLPLTTDPDPGELDLFASVGLEMETS